MEDNDAGNVIAWDSTRERRKDRPPPLSDDEIVRLRALLENIDRITSACPVARRAVEEG